MKNENRRTVKIGSCIIHYRQAPRGWAIVVLPEQFKVDNYYHGVHIHPDRKEIPISDPEIIFNIIFNHITREGRLIEEKIRKELGL